MAGKYAAQAPQSGLCSRQYYSTVPDNVSIWGVTLLTMTIFPGVTQRMIVGSWSGVTPSEVA
jgi:hypothetical protein